MPCYDGRNDARCITEYVEKIHDGVNAARLCAVFTVLQQEGSLDRVLRAADWGEAGVTRVNTINWWTQHQERDRKQREAEQAERVRKARIAKAKASARAKLSDADKKALGIK